MRSQFPQRSFASPPTPLNVLGTVGRGNSGREEAASRVALWGSGWWQWFRWSDVRQQNLWPTAESLGSSPRRRRAWVVRSGSDIPETFRFCELALRVDRGSGPRLIVVDGGCSLPGVTEGRLPPPRPYVPKGSLMAGMAGVNR